MKELSVTKKELIAKISHLEDDDEVLVWLDFGPKEIYYIGDIKWKGRKAVFIEGEPKYLRDKNVREMIKTTRKEKRITLRELSDKTGKKISYLSDVENGRKNIPDKQVLSDIEFALGLENKELTFYA